jgi:hypothetical protein
MQHGRCPGRMSFRAAPAAIPVVCRLLLSCLLLSLCNPAQAQPRNSTEAGGKMTPDAEPDAWLRRLAGRYEVDGAIAPAFTSEDVGSGDNQEEGESVEEESVESSIFTPRGFRGKVDCVAIGSGPGVQCMLNIMWIEEVGPHGEPVPVSYLDPSMMLLGLDPQRSEIKMLLVDNHGMVEGGAGRIGGNMAVFMVPCTNARVDNTPDANCERVTRFDAKPNSRLVHAWIDIRDTATHDLHGPQIVMTLRRAAEEKEITGE